MRRVTNRYGHHFIKWCTQLTKNVRLVGAFFLVSSFFISKNVFSQAGSPAVVAPTIGMRIDVFLQRQILDNGDWLRIVPFGLTGAGSYLFNDNGTIAAPYTTAEYSGLIFHKVDRWDDADDEGFDGGNKLVNYKDGTNNSY